MTEETEPGVSHFSIFVGGLRFIFDLMLLCVVLLCIGFIIFARNLERTQESPVRTADGGIQHSAGKLTLLRTSDRRITGVMVIFG